MSPVFPVEDKVVAFGLTWQTFTGPKAEKDAKTRAKEDEVPHIVALPDEDGGRFGYLKSFDVEGLARKPKRGQLLAAAALFESLPDVAGNAVYIHTYDAMGGGRVAAVIALYKGRIFEDKADLRVSEVLEHIQKLGKVLEDSGFGDGEAHQFQLYTSEPALFHDARELPLEALLQGDTTAATVLDARSRFVVRALMVLIIVGIFGSIAWDKYKDYEQQQELAAHPQTQGPSPSELYRQSLNAQLRQIGVTPAVFRELVLPVVHDREIADAGWNLSTLKCEASGVCREEWKRGVGTVEDFVAANEGTSIELDGNGTGLKNTYQLKLPRVATTREALPDAKSFAVPMQSLLQRYAAIGITSTTTPTKLIAVPNGVNESVLPHGIGVGGGGLTLTGPAGFLRDLLSRDAEAALQLPTNFYISSIQYTLNGPVEAMQFSLEGTFYVKQ